MFPQSSSRVIQDSPNLYCSRLIKNIWEFEVKCDLVTSGNLDSSEGAVWSLLVLTCNYWFCGHLGASEMSCYDMLSPFNWIWLTSWQTLVYLKSSWYRAALALFFLSTWWMWFMCEVPLAVKTVLPLWETLHKSWRLPLQPAACNSWGSH